MKTIEASSLTNISITITEEQKEKLQRKSIEEDLTVSQIVRRAVNRELEASEKSKAGR